MTGSGRGSLRGAIVGAGLMGRWHAAAIRRAGARVEFVYDEDVERARQLAAARGARVADTLEQAIRGCDVVHVCTPLSTHARIAMAALANGRAVLCEKPIAESPDATRVLFAEAARRGTMLVPTHQYLFQRAIVRVQEALPSLGKPLHVDSIACTAGAVGYSPEQTDRVALDILPHPISLMERLLPGSLALARWSVAGREPGEIRAVASVGGTSLGVLVSCAGRPPVNQLRLVAELGTVNVDLFHGFATIDRGRASRAQKIRQPFSSALSTLGAASHNLMTRAIGGEMAYPGLRELVAATYDAVARHGPPPISVAESLTVADVCENIRIARHAIV